MPPPKPRILKNYAIRSVDKPDAYAYIHGVGHMDEYQIVRTLLQRPWSMSLDAKQRTTIEAVAYTHHFRDLRKFWRKHRLDLVEIPTNDA